MTREDIYLLKRIRDYATPAGGVSVTHAVYIPPAQALRNAADRMEQQERDMVAFDELIKRLEVE